MAPTSSSAAAVQNEKEKEDAPSAAATSGGSGKRKLTHAVNEAALAEVVKFVKKQRPVVVLAEAKLDILLLQAKLRNEHATGSAALHENHDDDDHDGDGKRKKPARHQTPQSQA